MVWWIAGGVLAASLVVLLGGLLALAGRLRELRAVSRTLQRRAGDVAALNGAAVALQERIARLREPMELAERRAAAVRARRAGRADA